MTAITRHTDREETVAASADFLAKRRVHDVGAATRSDWTRRLNRGTRETTGSVRRSIEAVTEGLEGSAPDPHLLGSSAYPKSPRQNGLGTLIGMGGPLAVSPPPPPRAYGPVPRRFGGLSRHGGWR